MPYEMIEPTLKRIPVEHLKRIESLNRSYFEVEDIKDKSDKLWEPHCTKFSDSRKPGESWRGLFRRCEREKDKLLQHVTKRIKLHEQKAKEVPRGAPILPMAPPTSSRAAVGVRAISGKISTPTTAKKQQQPKAALMLKSRKMFRDRFRR